MAKALCAVTSRTVKLSHSDDRVEVYTGCTEPVVVCGFCATYYPELVALAARGLTTEGLPVA